MNPSSRTRAWPLSVLILRGLCSKFGCVVIFLWGKDPLELRKPLTSAAVESKAWFASNASNATDATQDLVVQFLRK